MAPRGSSLWEVLAPVVCICSTDIAPSGRHICTHISIPVVMYPRTNLYLIYIIYILYIMCYTLDLDYRPIILDLDLDLDFRLRLVLGSAI